MITINGAEPVIMQQFKSLAFTQSERYRRGITIPCEPNIPSVPKTNTVAAVAVPMPNSKALM